MLGLDQIVYFTLLLLPIVLNILLVWLVVITYAKFVDKLQWCGLSSLELYSK